MTKTRTIIQESFNDISDSELTPLLAKPSKLTPTKAHDDYIIEFPKTYHTDNFSQLEQGFDIAPAWPERISRASHRFFHATKQGIKKEVMDFVHHPLANSIAIATAAPSVLFAIMQPSGKDPSQIGQSWWQEMDDIQRTNSMVNAICSLWVNYTFGKAFNTEALSMIKACTRQMFNSPRDFIQNILSFISGLSGAASAGSLTLEALASASPFISIPAAVLCMIVVGSSRLIGTHRVINMVMAPFSENAYIQRRAINMLKHINSQLIIEIDGEHLPLGDYMQRILANKIDHKLWPAKLLAKQPLVIDDSDYEALLSAAILALGRLEHFTNDTNSQTLYYQKTIAEHLHRFSYIGLQLVTGLAIAFPAFLFFGQKGFDAVNLVSKKAADHDLNGLNMSLKWLISSVPGLATAMLYGMSAKDSPKAFFNHFLRHLYHHPSAIPAGLLLFARNYFASTSNYTIASSILKREHNILGALNESQTVGLTLAYLSQAGAFVVNTMPSMRPYAPKPALPNRIRLQELIDHFQNPAKHMIHQHTAQKLFAITSNSTFFQKHLANDGYNHIKQHDMEHEIEKLEQEEDQILGFGQ
jgi:hypothetical protein